MRQIDEINVHCSATRPGWMAGQPGQAKVKEIRRWHVEVNNWADVGYHYLIDRDGKCFHGRAVERSGAFEPKVNARAIGVCLIGGYAANATDDFEQHFTPEQDEALRKLIKYLRQAHPTIRKVTGHNDYSSKGCPGFKVGRWLAGKPSARSFAQSGTAVGAGGATVAAGGLAATEVVSAINETRTAVQDAQAAHASADPMRWVLLALILAGAGYALWRRWSDWQGGRR